MTYFEAIEKSQGGSRPTAILATLKMIETKRNRSEAGLYIANVFPRFLLSNPTKNQLWDFARGLTLNYRFYSNPQKPNEETIAREIQLLYQRK
jgi:hypothetical protein